MVEGSHAMDAKDAKGLTFFSSLWLGGLGICVLLVALRWNSLDAPLVRDEGEYAYAAQLLGHDLLPYSSSRAS